MRTCKVLSAALTGLLAAGPATAQSPKAGPNVCAPGGGPGSLVPVPAGSSTLFPPPGSSDAVSPTREVLERVNLRSEWTAYIPMDGRADGLGPVQVVEGGQIFVQTKAGRLIALDAVSGTTQWVFRYPKAYANLFPVAVTDRYVFAVNVNTLYSFDRYSGLQEFAFNLPGLSLHGAGGPSAGPVADGRYVYLVLGSSRLAAFQYPTPLVAPAPGPGMVIGPDGRPLPPETKGPSLANQAATRYGGSAYLQVGSDPNPFQRITPRPSVEQSGLGLGLYQKTPSLTALQRITPPYSLDRGLTTPSVAVLPSLKQPYTTQPPHLRYNQQTPSILAMPPSVAQAFALSNLRPRLHEPTAVWPAVAPGRTIYEPIQTPTQLWFTTEGPLAFTLSKATGERQGVLELSAPIAAPAAGPVVTQDGVVLGFFSQEDGTVIALDLPGGTRANPKIEWRSNVGGFLNHKPFTTANGVYASGENAGVARLDPMTGEVTWRTVPMADRILAVNDEFAYIRDRHGNILIYPRTIPNNPASPLAQPVAHLDLREFHVPVTNELTDRILIGADNGLLICLRDASPKYARPVRTAPALPTPPQPKKVEPAVPAEPKEPV